MTYRNRVLLDLAHVMPCCADFEHECNAYNGVEPMHCDSHIFGRGGWHKSHDFAFAAGCRNAHKILTAKVNDSLSREQKFFDWLRSYVKTWLWLWENERVRIV